MNDCICPYFNIYCDYAYSCISGSVDDDFVLPCDDSYLPISEQ